MSDEFDNEDPFESLQKMMEEKMKHAENHNKFVESVSAALEVHNEEAEREILMELWSAAGNSPHSYFMAMQVIHQFIKALKAMRSIKGLPDDLRLMVGSALSKCAALDVEAMKITLDHKAKFNIT